MMKRVLRWGMELLLAPLVVCLALVGRYSTKRVDVGLGPEPIINNLYHKEALKREGFSVETFASHVSHITDRFDLRADRGVARLRLLRPLGLLWLWVIVARRYRCVYIYFNGGVVSHLGRVFLWRWEPWLHRMARLRTVVMPYGSDVQELTRTRNLRFRHAMTIDYPEQRHRRERVKRQIEQWTRHADHTLSGCDWVDYMYHWDTLMLAHFSIDTDDWRPQAGTSDSGARPLRILHAPNHRAIKGTEFFVRAVEELQSEGLPIELVILERVPNTEVRRVMEGVDLVADQLVVGWYAMLAIEAMALAKPVLCHIREDLEELYVLAGLLDRGELPIIRCSPETVKAEIRRLAQDRVRLKKIGAASRAYVEKHHSLEAIGAVFDRINRGIGVVPSPHAG